MRVKVKDLKIGDRVSTRCVPTGAIIIEIENMTPIEGIDTVLHFHGQDHISISSEDYVNKIKE